LATFNASPSTAMLTIGGGLAYGLFMVAFGRPMLRLFQRRYERTDSLGVDSYSVLLLVLMACAATTDALGIYAVFGAFVAGAVMPRGGFAKALTERTELLTTPALGGLRQREAK
jgi:Kef-type K+ transport system membrane component KefB